MHLKQDVCSTKSQAIALAKKIESQDQNLVCDYNSCRT